MEVQRKRKRKIRDREKTEREAERWRWRGRHMGTQQTLEGNQYEGKNRV
jgi:hypothetical protein